MASNKGKIILNSNKQNQPQKNNEEDLHKERMDINMISQCYNFCITSFMEKQLNPFEKECLNACLQNVQAFKLEVFNSFQQPPPENKQN